MMILDEELKRPNAFIDYEGINGEQAEAEE